MHLIDIAVCFLVVLVHRLHQAEVLKHDLVAFHVFLEQERSEELVNVARIHIQRLLVANGRAADGFGDCARLVIRLRELDLSRLVRNKGEACVRILLNASARDAVLVLHWVAGWLLRLEERDLGHEEPEHLSLKQQDPRCLQTRLQGVAYFLQLDLIWPGENN